MIEDVKKPAPTEPEISIRAKIAYVPESAVIPPEADDGENQS
jgi:hypothetical protein